MKPHSKRSAAEPATVEDGRSRRASAAEESDRVVHRVRTGTRRDVFVNMGNDALPLYRSIKFELTRAISQGKIQAGSPLPTEKELANRFQVSVGTVRRAMADLVAEKVLVRQQGRGTFLAPVDSTRMLNSFWHIARRDGGREVPIVQTLRFEEGVADEHTAMRLKIHTGDPIFVVVNLMLMGGDPVLLDGLHIPKAIFPTLTQEQFVSRDATIYDLYQTRFHVTVVKTIDYVRAISADSDTAKRLDVAFGTPLLEVVRVAYALDDQPVELRRSLLSTEHYEFVDITDARKAG